MKTKVEYQPGITETNKIICEKYWLRESDKRNGYIYTCEQIGQEFGLKHSEISLIAKNNAQLVVLDCQCLECGEPKICYVRGHLTQLKLDSWRCDRCWEILQERQMQELYKQRREQERLEEEKRQAITDCLKDYRVQQEGATLPLEKISLTDKLLLMAIVESLGSDNLKTTLSLKDNLQIPLSPLYTMDEKILEHLFKANILLINPMDSLNYTSLTESGDIDINLDYSQATFDFAYDIKDLTSLRMKVKEQKTINDLVNNLAYKDWCENIQLAECVSYLIERSAVNDLAPPLSEKMMSLLIANLTAYSVAELYSLIWMAVESASSYSNKPNITKKHASNSIYTILQSNIDKVSNGIWKRRTFNRDINLPKSAITTVFFDDIFKMYDCGYRYRLDELLESLGVEQLSKENSYSTLGRAQAATESITFKLKIN